MDWNTLLDYNFNNLTLILLGATVFFALLNLWLILPLLGRIIRRNRSDNSIDLDKCSYIPVSVIVYNNHNSDNMAALLDDLLTQDYPVEYEVIVVSDGIDDETAQTVGRLQTVHNNLYLTMTPDHSRNLSRRKLAVTLGVKAARYEALLLTKGNCRIPSSSWLRSMARHFATGKEVVAGYTYPVSEGPGKSWAKGFDRMFRSTAWLASGINGNLWRGDGCNLGYTRRLFFDNKGFSQSLNLVNGDDDIFISRIANRSNSVVELSSSSMTAMEEYNPKRSFSYDKISRRFTGRSLPHGTGNRMNASCLTLWLAVAGAVAASFYGAPSAIPAAASVVTLIVTSAIIAARWRKAAAVLHMPKLRLTLLPLMLWHPFFNLFYIIKGRKHRTSHYTWS